MTQVSVTKNLKMHNNLLLDVISRQAGSLCKAVLEGTVNYPLLKEGGFFREEEG